MNSLCVFCGSSPGKSPQYLAAARRLGEALAWRRIRLIYGGGRVGIMGEVADSVLASGGEVVGIIPRTLMEREVGHTGLTQLHVVESMHQRKAMMADLSDGFVALPGGIGTMEEFFEVWTWGQLGLHQKPYGLLDVAGYFQPLISFLDHMTEEGFLREGYRDMVLVETDPEALLERLVSFTPLPAPRWIERDQT